MNNGAPYYYDYSNKMTSMRMPSTVHVHDTALAYFFKRYLLQKAISVYKLTAPEHWENNYFLYGLFTWGYMAVINTDKFGVIPQGCGLGGYGVQYQPTYVTIANPLLNGIIRPRIDVQCTIIRLMPDYGGIMDLIDYYGDLLALCADTAGINILNSKLSYVFASQNKTQSESFKKLFDRIASGEPASFIDKGLYNSDGSINWTMFNQNLKQTYIASNILEDMRKIENMFCTEMGIPNANTEKKERMLTDEVNANNVEVLSRADMILQELQKSCEKTNNMFFGGSKEVWFDWRVQPKEEVKPDESATFSNGPL